MSCVQPLDYVMRQLEQAAGIPGHSYDRADAESLRMRRGKVGGYADYVSADQVAMLEAGLPAALSPQAKALVARTGFKLAV